MTTIRPRETGSRPAFGAAVVAVGALLLAMWVLEGFDQASGNALDAYGIRPHTDEGLVAIFVAPWLHGGWAHLVGNSLPFLVLGILVLLDGWRKWTWATLTVVVASGVLVWLLSPPSSITLGASGIVFGWLTYLLVRGFYSGRPGQIAIGVLVFVVYGGVLWGVLPTDAGISWQGHLGGAAGGWLAARWLHRADRRSRATVA